MKHSNVVNGRILVWALCCTWNLEVVEAGPLGTWSAEETNFMRHAVIRLYIAV